VIRIRGRATPTLPRAHGGEPDHRDDHQRHQACRPQPPCELLHNRLLHARNGVSTYEDQSLPPKWMFKYEMPGVSRIQCGTPGGMNTTSPALTRRATPPL